MFTFFFFFTYLLETVHCYNILVQFTLEYIERINDYYSKSLEFMINLVFNVLSYIIRVKSVLFFF